jgi:hypothetical protein
VPFIFLVLLKCSWRDYYASVAIAERIALAEEVQPRMPVEMGKSRPADKKRLMPEGRVREIEGVAAESPSEKREK